MTWGAAAEADAITGALRALAPEPTAVPMIRTSRPFYGARVCEPAAHHARKRPTHVPWSQAP